MKLSSLPEDDESFNALAPGVTSSTEVSQTDLPALQTPTTKSQFHPGLEEMHPSKVHRSTTKPTAVSSLGPTSIGEENVTTASQSDSMALTVAHNTPTKLPGAWPPITSPTFEFTINHDDSLSAEAQRIMESVRREATKIKAQMQAERDQQDLDNKEAYHNLGRKIAQPKGTPGRYSDVHREEFKRMESIAGHASIWKNKLQPNAASSSSKSPSDHSADVVESQLPRSKSSKSLQASRSQDFDRIENMASGKRAKKRYDDDTSTARPISRDEHAQVEITQPIIESKAVPPSRLPSAFTTPTKASLARAASVKSMKPSLIPSPSRSNLARMIGSPSMIKSEGSKKYRRSLAKFGNMKNLLHRRQPGLTKDPNKDSARPSLALPEEKLRLDKALPTLPQPDQARSSSARTTVDRVNHTPTAKSHLDDMPASPSPSKIPAAAPSLRKTALAPNPTSYPSISNSPNITTRVKIPTAPVPGDFTFRSDKTILFSPAPQTPTIRRVRPSGVSTPLATFDPLPPIPHGLPNKKRRRAESDDEEDIENVAPARVPTRDDADEPQAKKLKPSPQKAMPTHDTSGATPRSKIPQARASKEKTPGRGVLSLSRLNMLARPKTRH